MQISTKQPDEKKISHQKIFIIRKVIKQNKWVPEEDKKLINLAQNFNERKWKEISQSFPGKNALQCFSRYKRIKPGVNKGPWKPEEDNKILKLIDKFGKKWSKISNIIKTRNGKQIRDRYLNILAPNLNKKKFTIQEDIKLIKLFKIYGNKWAKIKEFFKNRTTEMIKNRFHSSIKKKYQNYLVGNKSVEILENKYLNSTNNNNTNLNIFFNNNNNNDNINNNINNNNINNSKIEINNNNIIINDNKLYINEIINNNNNKKIKSNESTAYTKQDLSTLKLSNHQSSNQSNQNGSKTSDSGGKKSQSQSNSSKSSKSSNKNSLNGEFEYYFEDEDEYFKQDNLSN